MRHLSRKTRINSGSQEPEQSGINQALISLNAWRVSLAYQNLKQGNPVDRTDLAHHRLTQSGWLNFVESSVKNTELDPVKVVVDVEDQGILGKLLQGWALSPGHATLARACAALEPIFACAGLLVYSCAHVLV